LVIEKDAIHDGEDSDEGLNIIDADELYEMLGLRAEDE
jgi:hypothetical protein